MHNSGLLRHLRERAAELGGWIHQPEAALFRTAIERELELLRTKWRRSITVNAQDAREDFRWIAAQIESMEAVLAVFDQETRR